MRFNVKNMGPFTIRGVGPSGEEVIGPLETNAALHKATELQANGYSSIRLTEVASGVDLDIEHFLNLPQSRAGNAKGTEGSESPH